VDKLFLMSLAGADSQRKILLIEAIPENA